MYERKHTILKGFFKINFIIKLHHFPFPLSRPHFFQLLLCPAFNFFHAPTLKLIASSSFIIFVRYIYIYTLVYACTRTNTTCRSILVICVHMVSGLISLYGTTKTEAPPWERPSPPLWATNGCHGNVPPSLLAWL